MRLPRDERGRDTYVVCHLFIGMFVCGGGFGGGAEMWYVALMKKVQSENTYNSKGKYL